VARQHQRDPPLPREPLQLALDPGDVRPTQPVERRDGAGLEKVGHRPSLTTRRGGAQGDAAGSRARRFHPTMRGPVRLVVAHYHFRPGGVRSVIESATGAIAARTGAGEVLLLAGEPPDPHWATRFARRIAPARLEIAVIPGAGYLSEQSATTPGLARRIERLLAERPVAALWAHNLALGRNLHLAVALARACAHRAIPLVALHHDWWFDQRWQRWPEMRASGFRTLRSVARALFPESAPVAHATVNRGDAAMLAEGGLPEPSWLPNPVEHPDPPDSRRLRETQRWLRGATGTAGPIWLAPSRWLRRKNIAEGLLLARWLRPGATLATTGAPSSPDEGKAAAALARAAQQNGWPYRPGLLAQTDPSAPAVPELIAACEAVVVTSVHEGFGLPALEAAAAGRPSLLRILPGVTSDLESLGFAFPHAYGEIAVPPDLFDWNAEAQRQHQRFGAWRLRLPRALRAAAEPPALLGLGEPSPVPFSRLTPEAQREVLRHPAPTSWVASAPLNPLLADWRIRAAEQALEPAPWPERAESLAPSAYADRFASALGRAGKGPAPDAAESILFRCITARLAASRHFPILWEP
jgi:glycosyltransferase involved in cell wall biosynthesis